MKKSRRSPSVPERSDIDGESGDMASSSVYDVKAQKGVFERRAWEAVADLASLPPLSKRVE